MLLADQYYTQCVIGVKTVPGAGQEQLQIHGAQQETLLILSMIMTLDVLAQKKEAWIVNYQVFTAL